MAHVMLRHLGLRRHIRHSNKRRKARVIKQHCANVSRVVLVMQRLLNPRKQRLRPDATQTTGRNSWTQQRRLDQRLILLNALVANEIDPARVLRTNSGSRDTSSIMADE
jgi:hypothetical protein